MVKISIPLILFIVIIACVIFIAVNVPNIKQASTTTVTSSVTTTISHSQAVSR